MYKEYFGLRESPFSIAPDPHYFFISEGHREALAHLMYGINSDGGFVLLTGEVGTGKTTVCRCLLQQMPENCETAFILNPKLSSVELLASICDEFRITYPKGNETVKDLVARIYDFLLIIEETDRKAILIIEEAQNLNVEVLEQIRLLTNLETSQRKLLQIIMLGQPELREILAKPELRQLSQRITARYHLGPLAREEVSAYVNHRLSVAGLVRGELFPPHVMKMLYVFTAGVPRLINVICDRALLGTYTQGKPFVDKKTLVAAAREVSGKSPKLKQKNVFSWSATLLVIIILGAAAWHFKDEIILSPKESPVGTQAQSVPATSVENKENATGKTSSRDSAYQALFNAWQISYDPKVNNTACEQAQTQNLRCHEGKGDIETLRTINKPVVLRLIDGQGKDYYLTIIALQGGSATYALNGITQSGEIHEVLQNWQGNYELLWRLPKEYEDTLKPGGRGPFVMWLDTQLSIVDGKKPRSKPRVTYDEEMVKKVKALQSAAGLKPDGIVGPTTVGRIIMKIGSEGPNLNEKKGVN